jgi:hypothetical protein
LIKSLARFKDPKWFPDISAIKEVLEGNEGCEVITSLTSEWNKSLEGVDLIIWHEPGIKFDQSILELIKQKNTSTFYIIGPNTSSGIVSKLNIGISVATGNQLDETQASINKSFSAFELSEKAKEAVDFFPPLTSKFGSININGNNLFNKSYIAHLSRLKNDGIPNVGRNIVLGINFNL